MAKKPEEPVLPKYQIFVSSTFEDLREVRQAIVWEILKAGHIPVGMENFSARNDRGWDLIERTLQTTDYYVLILAGRYGSVDDNTGMSWTEREFRRAIELGIPVLPFVRDQVNIRDAERDTDANAKKKLAELIAQIGQSRLYEPWTTHENLGTRVTHALSKAIKDNPRPGWHRGPRGVGQLYAMADCLKDVLELAKTCGAQDVLEVKHLGLDMSVAALYILMFLNECKAKEINYRILVMGSDFDLCDPLVTNEVVGWGKYVGPSIGRIQGAFKNAIANPTYPEREVRAEIRQYKGVPFFHGSALRGTKKISYISICHFETQENSEWKLGQNASPSDPNTTHTTVKYWQEIQKRDVIISARFLVKNGLIDWSSLEAMNLSAVLYPRFGVKVAWIKKVNPIEASGTFFFTNACHGGRASAYLCPAVDEVDSAFFGFNSTVRASWGFEDSTDSLFESLLQGKRLSESYDPTWDAEWLPDETSTPMIHGNPNLRLPCPANTPIYNPATEVCEACPPEFPIWDETTQTCTCPSTAEIPNGLDDDCDGQLDEGDLPGCYVGSAAIASIVDIRDGHSYPVTEVAGDCWTAMNTGYDFADGDYCFNDALTCSARFYTWQSAANACPPGWRLPSKDEMAALQMAFYVPGSLGCMNDHYRALFDCMSGFCASTSGFRNSNGSYILTDGFATGSVDLGGYWTSTPGANAGEAFMLYVQKGYNHLCSGDEQIADATLLEYPTTYAFATRCVKSF